MRENALYYPYIHVRDVDWLKATLLLFNQVRRMVPLRGTIGGDDPDIEPFTVSHGGGKPLLDSADLNSERARRAQLKLAKLLRESAKDAEFMRRFGYMGISEQLQKDPLGFQIHQWKLDHELRETLGETQLAWKPGLPEPWDPGQEYVQLHPRVGEAVMSTLAIACATAEGLDIVSDERSRKLHDCLLERDQDAVFDSYLSLGQAEEPEPEPIEATGSEIFQFFISFACDTTTLDAKTLATMGANRQPLIAIMEELDKRARGIDPMDPGPRRIKRLQDEAADILRTWSQDRRNMDNFWKAFFGFGSVETGSKAVEKIVEKSLAGGAGVVAGSLLGAAPGLAIGVALHAAKTHIKLGEKEKESPFQYLSMLGKAGVTFEYDKVMHSR